MKKKIMSLVAAVLMLATCATAISADCPDCGGIMVNDGCAGYYGNYDSPVYQNGVLRKVITYALTGAHCIDCGVGVVTSTYHPCREAIYDEDGIFDGRQVVCPYLYY